MPESLRPLLASGGLRRVLLGPTLVVLVAGGFAATAPNAYKLAVGVNIAVAAIAAMGLTMAVGGAGQLALGQAGFMAIGAYAVAVLTRGSESFPFLVALLIAVVLASFAGLVVGYIALRLKGNYLAMATLATAMIIHALLLIDGPLGGPSGLAAIPAPSIAGYEFIDPMAQFLLVAVALVACYLVAQLVTVSRFGRELRALRDDEVAAQSVGVNITRRKIQIFTLSAAFGGLAGGLLASIQSAIDPALFNSNVSIQLLVMAVIGGLGQPLGAILGAGVIQWITQSIPSAGDWALTVLGVVVVLMMAFVPKGFAGLGAMLTSLRARAKRRSGRSDSDRSPTRTGDPDSASVLEEVA